MISWKNLISDEDKPKPDPAQNESVISWEELVEKEEPTKQDMHVTHYTVSWGDLISSDIEDRQPILGHKNHPDRKEFIFNYDLGGPEGTWLGILEDKVWGKRTALILYFNNVMTGKGFKFGVFARDRYTPRDAGPDFTKQFKGEIYKLTTIRGKRGGFRFSTAVPIPVRSRTFTFVVNYMDMKEVRWECNFAPLAIYDEASAML